MTPIEIRGWIIGTAFVFAIPCWLLAVAGWFIMAKNSQELTAYRIDRDPPDPYFRLRGTYVPWFTYDGMVTPDGEPYRQQALLGYRMFLTGWFVFAAIIGAVFVIFQFCPYCSR
jgi:hypothetical protein